MAMFSSQMSDEKKAEWATALEQAAELIKHDRYLYIREQATNGSPLSVDDLRWRAQSGYQYSRPNTVLKRVFGSRLPVMRSTNTFLPQNPETVDIIALIDLTDELELKYGDYEIGMELRHKERTIEKRTDLSGDSEASRAWLQTLPSEWSKVRVRASIDFRPGSEKIDELTYCQILAFQDPKVVAEAFSESSSHSRHFTQSSDEEGNISEALIKWVWPLGSHKIVYGDIFQPEEPEGTGKSSDLEASISMQVTFSGTATAASTSMSDMRATQTDTDADLTKRSGEEGGNNSGPLPKRPRTEM